MSPAKKPIPIPFKRRLQSLQSKVMPLLVFGVAVLVTAMLWQDTISPAMLVGEVATVKSKVTSPIIATVQRLHAQHLQVVRAGDVLAELRPCDPRQQMDSIQGKLSLLRLQLTDNDATNQHREAMDFERLRLDWLLEKVNLTTALTKAKKATMDLEIARSMDVAPASSKRYLQEAELLKQAADAEVTERQDLVDSLGIHIKELSTTITPSPAAKDDLLVKEVSSLEARLIAIEQSQSVLMLRAPMDGMVTEVLRRDGENLVAGEALIIITATRPESIIGYLRQPLPLEPEVGQEVEVRTHGRERLRGLAVVTRVGSHFEPILNAALHPSATAEVGVPLEVSLPANLKLRPGELVSLVIRPTPVN